MKFRTLLAGLAGFAIAFVTVVSLEARAGNTTDAYSIEREENFSKNIDFTARVDITPAAFSAAPVVSTGNLLNIGAGTVTDNSTAASGTATQDAFIAIQQPTLKAKNTVVTTTDAATLYIANAPAAGTNETISNDWALWVDNGASRLDGPLKVKPAALSGSPGVASGAWGDIAAATFTDNSTAASGTATSQAFVAVQQPTLAATNATVTTTTAATVYIADAPAAGTNETITNAYALDVAAGITNLGGGLKLSSTTAGGSISISAATSGTATVRSGCTPVCSVEAVSGTAVLKTCAVSSTTLTATLSASDTATVDYVCF